MKNAVITRREAHKAAAAAGVVIAQGLGAAKAAVPALAPTTKPAGENWYESGLLTRKTVRFKNSYGLEVAGDLYAPKELDAAAKHAAIVISHPFGPVRQQAARLYAQRFA